MGAAGLILLLACTNVANLLLARASPEGGRLAYGSRSARVEAGFRVALGASSEDVLRLVVGKGLGLAALRVGAGLVGALAAGRVIGGMLYDVRPTDPTIIVSMSLLLAAVVLLASYLPARRALRVDPVTSLRSE
jgi:ABC-type antimicrobial peptide transport system permease subunit